MPECGCGAGKADERDPETLQRISEPCPKCGSSGRVVEGQGVYWYCGKWYPSVSKPGGEPMTATTGNCDEVAALQEHVTSIEMECNALRAELTTALRERNAENDARRLVEAEVERMRPVVEAVLAYDDHFEETHDGGYDVKPGVDLGDMREDFDRIWNASATYREANK